MPLTESQVTFLNEYAAEELAIREAEAELRSRRSKHERNVPPGLPRTLYYDTTRTAVVVDGKVVVIAGDSQRSKLEVESVHKLAAAPEETSDG